MKLGKTAAIAFGLVLAMTGCSSSGQENKVVSTDGSTSMELVLLFL